MRLLMAVVLLSVSIPDLRPEATFGTLVDDQGQISLPTDFRRSFTHLGSWFVPEGDAAGFHDVYTQADSVAYFRKNGIFPDGAVLVKELRGHQSRAMTTGTPAMPTARVNQWFVMVKDSQGRFEGNGSWGDGWGWALFKPGQKGNLSGNYKTDCLGCHFPAKERDWIYTEGYPTLVPAD